MDLPAKSCASGTDRDDDQPPNPSDMPQMQGHGQMRGLSPVITPSPKLQTGSDITTFNRALFIDQAASYGYTPARTSEHGTRPTYKSYTTTSQQDYRPSRLTNSLRNPPYSSSNFAHESVTRPSQTYKVPPYLGSAPGSPYHAFNYMACEAPLIPFLSSCAPQQLGYSSDDIHHMLSHLAQYGHIGRRPDSSTTQTQVDPSLGPYRMSVQLAPEPRVEGCVNPAYPNPTYDPTRGINPLWLQATTNDAHSNAQPVQSEKEAYNCNLINTQVEDLAAADPPFPQTADDDETICLEDLSENEVAEHHGQLCSTTERHVEVSETSTTQGNSNAIDTETKNDNNGEKENGNNDKVEESYAMFKQRLIKWFKQMMFVSGETAEPGPETTWMIEEIVREQVVEMLKEASTLANRRGSKSISIVDLIFQIRHNTAKVSRLKTFLSWKDVRKNVKDSDDKAGGADADALDLEDGGPMGANPAAPQKTQANKKAKLMLPWEVQSYYSETVPEREDEEDEEEEEQNEATLARLASADERTKNMTKDEYVYWSDCRQASFTFRKGKRFREWAGFGTIIDSKPNDDVVDILGFLTFEIVQTLTEEALRVKHAEDLANKKAGRGDIEASKKRKREGCTLFEMPEQGRTPVEPRHVQEAFRRLQIVPNKYKFMRSGMAGMRTPLRMI